MSCWDVTTLPLCHYFFCVGNPVSPVQTPGGENGIQNPQLTPGPIQVLSIAGQLYVSPHGAQLSSTPSCFLMTRIFPGFSSKWWVTDLVDGEELEDFQ